GSISTSKLFGFFHGFFDGADHVERLLGQIVVVAGENAFEAADRVLQRNVLAGRAGEDFGNVERLRQETFDFPRAVYRLLVFFREFIHAEDGDDVFQFLVTLQYGLYATRDFVVFDADDQRVELTRGRVERVDRRVDTFGGDVAAQYHGRVQVGEGGGRRRVGQVIRWNIDGQDRGDRAGFGRRNPFLQHAHLFRQGRLITYSRRHTTEQCRYFGTGQRVAVDVVDEQQNVAAFVAEFFRH